MYFTKREAITEHRKMWTWIAESFRLKKTPVEKADYFKTFYEGESNVYNDCFMCEYIHYVYNDLECRYCPLIFVKGQQTMSPISCGCCHKDSPYVKFSDNYASIKFHRYKDVEEYKHLMRNCEKYAYELANLKEAR